jgi:hypothetical protein
VPTGEYELSVALQGRCRIYVAGHSESVLVEGSAFDPTDVVGAGNLASLGTVVIPDGVFRVRLEPETSEGWMRLTTFGFVPVGLEEDDEEIRARQQALQDMGYGG